MSLSLALCAILGFEPIVSTNWIFDDEDDENDELLILFPIANFYTPVYAFDIFHNPSLLPLCCWLCQYIAATKSLNETIFKRLFRPYYVLFI